MKRMITPIVLGLTLAACDGGDIIISPSTVDNSTTTNNTSQGNTPVVDLDAACASYANDGGQTIRGKATGNNCVYGAAFLDAGKPLEVDMTIPALEQGGAHIFQGSLFVGHSYDTDEELAEAGITEGGDGPTLTIEAGATIAFESTSNFLIVNRGSQIFAVGTADEPITFTSRSDVDGELESFDAVQQWGGIVINGFGVTNKCAYTGTFDGGDLATSDCHVKAEGAAGLNESQYGGDNNEDGSGRLEYVIVKHTGAEVASGDELNGISFGGVGSGTIVKNLQVYSTYDDGIEMFGGAVSIENFVAVYVRDDSIDIDEGWSGSITNALVIQAEDDGNHCIEADGLGSFDTLMQRGADEDRDFIEDRITQGIQSRPTITGLTCIISANAGGTHDPGAGWLLREGVTPTIKNSMVIGSFNADANAASNYCISIENRSLQAAQDDALVLDGNVFACKDRTDGGALPNGTTVSEWVFGENNQFAAIDNATCPAPTANTELQLVSGVPPIYSLGYDNLRIGDSDATVTAPVDADGDATASFPGAVSTSASENWLRPDGTDWTYGIFDGSREEPLWIESASCNSGS